jgi:NAD(P)-dependent dehydrogenase (short-subunit alcohol dehydrogenase family)
MKKHVIVTGTSRGIGLELVKNFNRMGYTVHALSRNSAPVDDLGLENCYSYSCDLCEETFIKTTLLSIKANTSGVEVIINNAGKFLNQNFLNTNLKDVKSVYETNIFGVFAITSMCMNMFTGIKHVVNISSMGGIQGSVKFPGLAAYSSSKAALICLTELLAEEFKDEPIAFNCLALGAVKTEMLEEAFPGFEAPVTAKEMADYIADFALNGYKYYNGKTLQVSNSTP